MKDTYSFNALHKMTSVQPSVMNLSTTLFCRRKNKDDAEIYSFESCVEETEVREKNR